MKNKGIAIINDKYMMTWNPGDGTVGVRKVLWWEYMVYLHQIARLMFR